jgi:ketosteroid isomerase-like protein
MGQARQVMDRISAAVVADDADALAQLYAQDAVADTPDEGRLEGRDAVVGWLRTFATAFTDITFEMIATSEAGDTAVDEAYLSATHTGPMQGPEGEIAPTGKRIRIRECDVITVRDGLVVSHRFYFDQLDFLGQLGLLEPSEIVLPDARTPSSPRSEAPAR